MPAELGGPYAGRYAPPVELNWFDERLAAAYDATSQEMFEPAVLNPAVDFLAQLAEGGRRWNSASAPVASSCR